MQRFYFDLKQTSGTEADAIGVDLEDCVAANREALRGLADILRERLNRFNLNDLTMEVRDGHGDVVINISVTIRHDLVKP